MTPAQLLEKHEVIRKDTEFIHQYRIFSDRVLIKRVGIVENIDDSHDYYENEEYSVLSIEHFIGVSHSLDSESERYMYVVLFYGSQLFVYCTKEALVIIMLLGELILSVKAYGIDSGTVRDLVKKIENAGGVIACS